MGDLTAAVERMVSTFESLSGDTSRNLGIDATISDLGLSLDSLAATRMDLGPTIRESILDGKSDDASGNLEGFAAASQTLGRADQHLADAAKNLIKQ